MGPPRQHAVHGVACRLFHEVDRRRRRGALTIPSGAPAATPTSTHLLASTRVAHDDEIYGENDKDPQQTSRNRVPLPIWIGSTKSGLHAVSFGCVLA